MEVSKKISVAVVCSSNQNRSMEAHNLLSKKGYNVKSYGTGSVVTLPGRAPNQPNVYQFGTTYEDMFHDLTKKDPQLLTSETCIDRSAYTKEVASDADCSYSVLSSMYTRNGILRMLDRNRRIKPCPEQFQKTKEEFDVIFTVEERIYDAVIEDLESRGASSYKPVQVINLDVKDNHEEATLGAFLILELCDMMNRAGDLENEIEEIIQEFEAEKSRTLLHTVAFY